MALEAPQPTANRLSDSFRANSLFLSFPRYLNGYQPRPGQQDLGQGVQQIDRPDAALCDVDDINTRKPEGAAHREGGDLALWLGAWPAGRHTDHRADYRYQHAGRLHQPEVGLGAGDFL